MNNNKNFHERILEILELPYIKDPIKTLHDCVHSTDCTLVADDGWQYESLFNNFKSNDNRDWQ